MAPRAAARRPAPREAMMAAVTLTPGTLQKCSAASRQSARFEGLMPARARNGVPSDPERTLEPSRKDDRPPR
jgi:hypothetical protein